MSPNPEDPAPGRGRKSLVVVSAAVVVAVAGALIVAGLRSGGQGSGPKRPAASAAPEPTEAIPTAAVPSGLGSFSGPADRVSITNSSLDYPAALASSVPGAGPAPPGWS